MDRVSTGGYIMKRSMIAFGWIAVLLAASAVAAAAPAELVPPLAGIKQDRPRLLLRPADTPRAISLRQLHALPRDQDFDRMLRQLEGLKPPKAAALAMVYRLTGRKEAAERALAVMRAWQPPRDKAAMNDPFNVYFTLIDMALAYDWLHDYAGFDAAAKAALRRKLQPMAENAFKLGNDHVFHNYVWMYNGGAMLWALATAGEDPAADRLFAGLRERFNGQLFRAMEYLEGSNGDSAGYWWLYCQDSATLVLLATQSAFETDVLGALRRDHGDWLARQLDYLVLSVLPDMRFIPWGDIVTGANGGVTHEMAAKIDALTWALRSPSGTFLSRWLAEKRGPERFYGETALFYFLYTRHLDVHPAPPPTAVLAGGRQGGHAIMRSDWSDDATVVGFRCTDFFGQHHHLDQGSFVIYRNGLLALDAGSYRHVGGEQMKTDAHNTLLLGGQGQRGESYQSASHSGGVHATAPQGAGDRRHPVLQTCRRLDGRGRAVRPGILAGGDPKLRPPASFPAAGHGGGRRSPGGAGGEIAARGPLALARAGASGDRHARGDGHQRQELPAVPGDRAGMPPAAGRGLLPYPGRPQLLRRQPAGDRHVARDLRLRGEAAADAGPRAGGGRRQGTGGCTGSTVRGRHEGRAGAGAGEEVLVRGSRTL